MFNPCGLKLQMLLYVYSTENQTICRLLDMNEVCCAAQKALTTRENELMKLKHATSHFWYKALLGWSLVYTILCGFGSLDPGSLGC
jgi:hypothetical protein